MTVTPSGVWIGSPMMVLESTISRILSIVVSMRSLSGVFFSMFSMRFILSFYAVSFSLCSLFCVQPVADAKRQANGTLCVRLFRAVIHAQVQ